MQLYRVYSIILLSALIFVSCRQQCDGDCVSGIDEGLFRIISADNGADLVFGNTKVYDKNKIRFYSIEGSDTTFFKSQDTYLNFNDSAIYVKFYPHTDTAYVQLDTTNVERLIISYTSYSTECCGTISNITSFTNNHLTDSAGVQIIKK